MYTISPANYAILAVLLIAALAALAAGLRTQWRRLGAAERGALAAGINWRAFGARVLGMSRVRRRPFAGLAHSLLFYGALIEILGHGLYALTFVGIPVYSGWFGRLFMEAGRELGGVMLLTGAVLLTVRRLHPPERLVVAGNRREFLRGELLLVATAAAGFLAEAVRLTDPASRSWGEILGQALAGALAPLGSAVLVPAFLASWWLHGALGLVFIALIGRTAMSHMVLGSVNAALAAPRPGITLRPIDFEAAEAQAEPVFGAATLAGLGPKLLLDVSACVSCGRCHEVCPAVATGKALSPKQVMVQCAEYLEQGRLDDSSLLERIGRQAIFDCTSCGACVEECPVSNSPGQAVLEFRRHYVLDRSEMPETMAAANRELETRGHPFVGTASTPDEWCQGLDVPIFEPGRTEYLLWIGCAARYEPRAQAAARALVRVLGAAGVSYGVLDEPRCTGDPAKMLGNELQFLEMANGNIEHLRSLGVQRVITQCAHCFNSLDRYYRELGASWEIVPHIVLIDRLMREGRLPPLERRDEQITLHDPCYMARHNGIVDPARDVIAQLGTLVEMPRNRKQSFCCGAGGGNYWGGQGGTARIADVRAREALATGASRLATACPFCLLTLSASAAREGTTQSVADVAEIVAEALPPPPPA